MAPLVTRYTAEFGLFGITIALIGWLLGRFRRAGVLHGDRCRVRRLAGAVPPHGQDETAAARSRHRAPARGRRPSSGAGLTKDDVVMLVRVLANWMVMAAAVWVATALLPGIHVHGGFFTYLALSLLFGLVNAVVGPLLHLVALPLSVFTVGGAALVVNGVLLLLTAAAQRPARCRGTGQRGARVARHLDRHHGHRAGDPADPGAGRRSGGRVQLSAPGRAGRVSRPVSPRLMHRNPRWLVDVSRVWDCRAAGR